MKKDLPNFNQIMLLGKQWDLTSVPISCSEGFIFEAFGSKKLLHIAPMDEAAFCFCLQKYLYQRGFSHGLRFIPNKYGDAYAIWDNFGAYLTDFYENSDFFLSNEYNLWRMTGLQAEFHNAAEGLEIPSAPLESINSPLEYAFWLTEQPPPPMTVHMLPIYEKLCSQSQKILEKCDNLLMKELCEEALEKRSVIHGRFNPAALCEYFGELMLQDYSPSSYGIPVWDLAYSLNYGMLKLGRERSIIRSGIAEYEKRRPLSRKEKTVLRLLLQLPMEFIYAINDWQEQQLTAEQFAGLLLCEEKLLHLRKDENEI